jgi:hypothetical protein
MEKTQLKQLICFLEDMASKENDMQSLLAIKTITLQVYSMLLDERKQIEAAYNNGKLNTTGDGNMYYFMNYISND